MRNAYLAIMICSGALQSWSFAQDTLIATPWTDHEYTEYRLTLNGGPWPGGVAYALEPSTSRPKNLVLRVRNSTTLTWYRAEVDRDTMGPLSSTLRRPISFNSGFPFRFGIMETVAVGYQSTTADWRAKERSRNIPLHRGTMDAAELAFLIRRLPLADGYSTAVPLLDEAGVVRKVGVAVKGIEQVKAPAGEFRCFMVETEIVPGRVQTFWIAAEPSRALIKTAMGSQQTELARLQIDGPASTPYQDKYVGFSFVAPPGWMVIPYAGPNIENQMHVDLMDPEGQAAYISLWSTPEKVETNLIGPWLDSRPEWRAQERTRLGLYDFKNRANSIHQYPIAGGRAQGTIADYVENGRKKIEYVTWFRTAHARMNITAGGIDPADFEDFMRRFQPLVDSVRLP